MSTIILHDKKNNNWQSLGIGPLTDAINPQVVRVKNGVFDLMFQYPVKGVLFPELKIGRWIVSDAGARLEAKAQRFEIVQLTKPMDGIVTVYCEHNRYRLLRSIVKLGSQFKDIPAQTALNQLYDRMEPKGDFSFFSDVTTRSSIDFTDPSKFSSAQDVLGGVRGSILDNFGGEYLFNNNEVKLLARAGRDTNVVVAYGKNLTDIQQEESIENTYTSVYGWAKVGSGDEEKILTLPETYIDSDYVGNYTERRIQMVDFSDKNPKDVNALRQQVKQFIKSNNVGVPRVNIKTKFADLASATGEEQVKRLEELDLCDTITVAFNDLGINATAQVIKTVWNVTLDTYESVELGDARTDFAKFVEDAQPDTDKLYTKVDFLEKAQKEASDIIHNPGKGHVVVYPSYADPQEWLIMDTTDINTAKKVWRWNIGGLGFSSTGYNGTYGLAMTNNGAIVADRMTTGTLRAIDIIGVAISASDITGTNITGGLIRGAHFVQAGSTNSTPIDINYGAIGFYKNENDALNNPNNKIAGMYCGTGIGTSTVSLLLFSGNRYFRMFSDGNSEIDGNFRVIGKVTAEKGLMIPNNAAIDFYSSLNMHGYSILNQSDIRLKEHIEDTTVDGILETKKLNFVEFDWKQNYQSNDPNKQPPNRRELGLIAQYSPFLSIEGDEDHYLRIDTTKQIMLNSLTNKQLIEKVERLENQLAVSKKKTRKYHRGGI